MNYLIISGSNRVNSGSRKVADYIASQLPGSEILDLHEINLPMWTEAMWQADSQQSHNWQQYADKFAAADGLVFIAAEWHGMVPAPLKNLMLHLTPATVGHKPALLVGVSAGAGGAYPIAEMRSHSVKNNMLLWIPDHVIVRRVKEVLGAGEPASENDQKIRDKFSHALQVLGYYSQHMKNLRDEAGFDLENYANGM